MSEVREIDTLTLPEDFEWGAWSGDYRPVFYRGECIGDFGGVLVKVTPPAELQGLLESELARKLLMAARHN